MRKEIDDSITYFNNNISAKDEYLEILVCGRVALKKCVSVDASKFSFNTTEIKKIKPINLSKKHLCKNRDNCGSGTCYLKKLILPNHNHRFLLIEKI